MEKNEISLHQVKIFLYVKGAGRWVTNQEIAAATTFSNRTIRFHTKHMVELGLFDHAEVFPGHRFRLAEKPEVRNKGYLLRITQAIEVFGLKG